MPQTPLDRAGIDFSLAIVQALVFGFSMSFPWLFPVLLGTNLLLTGGRQNKEHRALAVALFKTICTSSRQTDPDRGFRNGLKKYLRKDFSELSGWAPTGGVIWSQSIAMVIIGLASRYFLVQNLLELPTIWVYQAWITFEAVVITALITVTGYGVLKRRATFLEPYTNGDDHVEAPEKVSRIPDNKPASKQTSIKNADDDAEESRKVANYLDNKPKRKERPKIDVQFECLQLKLKKLCPKPFVAGDSILGESLPHPG